MSGPASAVPEDVLFAFEALRNLVTSCPDWAKRLDDLSGQIDQRQTDLAQFAELQSPCKTSLRKHSSTESLKPKDDSEAHPGADGGTSPENAVAVCTSDLANATARKDPSLINEANSPTSSAVERQRPQVAAAATAKARAALRRTQLGKKCGSATESMLTGDGPALAGKYRSESLVIVYYDSYVQSFFEEVVKFVSASRNLMRKAKMAAKVAQIKRMAELEMPDDEGSEGSDDGFGNGTAQFLPPQLSPSATQPNVVAEANGEKVIVADAGSENGKANRISMATPQRTSFPQTNSNGNSIPSPMLPGPFRPSMAAWPSISSYGRKNDTKQQPSVLDELDKGLECVQSMCEHAAHQFLRGGDCADEIVKLKERLTVTKAIADKELQLMLEGDQDGALKKLLVEDVSARNSTYRPQVMRRDMAVSSGPSPRLKTNLASGRGGTATATVAPIVTGAVPALGTGESLEVDEGIGGNELEADKTPPKVQFRSTLAMGSQVADRL